MNDRPRFFDDLAGVASGAISALAGLRQEVEAMRCAAVIDEADVARSTSCGGTNTTRWHEMEMAQQGARDGSGSGRMGGSRRWKNRLAVIERPVLGRIGNRRRKRQRIRLYQGHSGSADCYPG